MKAYRIWKPAYRPFRVGANPHIPVCTTVVPDSIHKIGRGVSVGVIKGFVFELKSGGVVGDSLEQVKRDFSVASPAVVRKQIIEATAEGKSADNISPDEFLKRR